MIETETSWRLATVAAVQMDLPGVYPTVEIQESDAPWRRLSIPVGFAEGTAIAYALKGIETPRPLTHELVATLLAEHGIQLQAVRIKDRQGATFLAELDTIGRSGQRVVSCRPSDALALLLRQKLPVPLLVAETLFT